MAPAKAPANETPEARFVRIANRRVQKALDALDLVGNLTGSAYKSTKEQRGKIVSALNKAVSDVAETLESGKTKASGFTL